MSRARPRRRRRSAVYRAAAVAVALALTTSCSSGGTMNDPTAAASASPTVSFAQLDGQITDALTRVRERLTAEVGADFVGPDPQPRTSACGSGGIRGFYRLPDFAGPIPDDRWADAVRIVTEIFTPLGATTSTVLQDEPGRHAIGLAGPNGIEVNLTSIQKADLIVTGPCGIPAS